MADMRTPGAGFSRESRLLFLTVVVCAVVLLVMARLRFPEPPPVGEAPASPAPLERLAARASYDALAADVQRVEAMIAPNLIGLRVVPRPRSAPRDLGDVLASADSTVDMRHLAAVRMSQDTAIAMIDTGTRIDGIVGETGRRHGVDTRG